jgi:Tfp pilus assembly protein PilO
VQQLHEAVRKTVQVAPKWGRKQLPKKHQLKNLLEAVAEAAISSAVAL